MSKRLRVFFLFLFFLPGTCLAGPLNTGNNGDSVWVSQSTKNPTWKVCFDKTKGGVITVLRQPYNGSNIAGTDVDNGGWGNCEVNFVVNSLNKWFNNRHDTSPSVVVVESTSTRFRFYLEADLIYSTYDSGDVKDTISCYYNRIIYDRYITVTGKNNTGGWRPNVFTWLQTAIEDSIIFADDDQIDIDPNIEQIGQKNLPAGQDTIHAQELFRTDNDTTFLCINFRNLYSYIINKYISHDASTRRGSGHGSGTDAIPGAYQHKFFYELGTLNHSGTDAQDRLVDYMKPCPITMTYGTGGTWAETKGCYRVTDGGNDSVRFTFTRTVWTDSTVFTPVIEVSSWDGGIPDSIYVGGVNKVRNTDFYADTVDAKDFLIVQYLTNLTATNTEFIIPSRTGGAPPATKSKLLLIRGQKK